MRSVYILTSPKDVLLVASNFQVIYHYLQDNAKSLKLWQLKSYGWLCELFRSHDQIAVPMQDMKYYTVKKYRIYAKYQAYLQNQVQGQGLFDV